jgi:hypothetical protein
VDEGPVELQTSLSTGEASAYTGGMKTSYLFILAGFFCASVSSAGLMYNYSQLTLQDLDQMNAMVNKKVKEYKREKATEILKEAVQAVYARPDNNDGMIEKVIPALRNELEENEQWENVVNALVDEAIGALKNPKPFKPIIQNTYAVFLENIIQDFKPFADREGLERKVLVRIRDAKIEMTKEALNERKLRDMKSHKSPSEIAAQALDNAAKIEEEAKKADAEAKAEAGKAEVKKKKAP